MLYWCDACLITKGEGDEIMKMVFIVLGTSAAAIMGFCLWMKIKTIYAQIQLKKSYKQTVAVNPIATSLPLNIHGIERIILERMVLLSMQVGRRHLAQRDGSSPYLVTKGVSTIRLEAVKQVIMKTLLRNEKRENLQTLIDQAGFHLSITVDGVSLCRLQSAMLGMAMGLVIGMSLSGFMTGMGCVIGGILGWNAPVWVLKRVQQERGYTMEQELGNLIEIVILGLRSGLSFDKAFSLYPHYFSSSLAETCALAQAQWTHGLISRSEGLDFIARSYDSSLLKRVTDSMERSLKFGTSLVDVLDAEVQESRAIRKAKMEERISKAPVKMLFPVGILILPAMLIYIMGPILLDLITGF